MLGQGDLKSMDELILIRNLVPVRPGRPDALKGLGFRASLPFFFRLLLLELTLARISARSNATALPPCRHSPAEAKLPPGTRLDIMHANARNRS